jgi:hypothetical protein
MPTSPNRQVRCSPCSVGGGRHTYRAGLLSETTERSKTDFQRLGLAVTLEPIRNKGARPFFRASVQAALPSLAGVRDLSMSVVDRSLPQAAGSRTWGFGLDLPANHPGRGSRRKTG